MSEFSACYVCSDIITDHELLDNITIINELCQLESISPHFIITTQQKHQQKSKDMLHEHAPYSFWPV